MEEKRRFNVVDLILVALVLFVALAIVGKILYPDLFKTKSGAVPVSCTLETDDVLSPYASSLSVGDRLFVGTDTPFGTVTEIKTQTLPANADEESGETETVFTVTVACSLSLSDGAYAASDGTMILTGRSYLLHTKDTAFTFSVKNLLETDASAANLS